MWGTSAGKNSLPVCRSTGQGNAKDKMKEINAGWRIVIVWGTSVGTQKMVTSCKVQGARYKDGF